MSTWTAGMASFRTVASAFNVILGRCGREIPGVLGQVAPKLGFRRVLSFLAQHARVRSCSAFADLLPTGATKRSGCRTSSSRKTWRLLADHHRRFSLSCYQDWTSDSIPAIADPHSLDSLNS